MAYLEFFPLLSVWVVLVIFELVGDWFPPTLTIVTLPDTWFTWELKQFNTNIVNGNLKINKIITWCFEWFV